MKDSPFPGASKMRVFKEEHRGSPTGDLSVFSVPERKPMFQRESFTESPVSHGKACPHGVPGLPPSEALPVTDSKPTLGL